MQLKKVTLVGVGLLGGSLGLAMKRRGLARRVEGYVRRAGSVAECKLYGVVDEARCDLLEAVQGADLVILCTPIAQMRELTETMLPALKPGAVVTDVGSVKGNVVETLEPLVGSAGGHFIGSHPMAGAEKMGVSFARADLFEKALCAITPTDKSELMALELVEGFWRGLGSRVMRMDPVKHDRWVSYSSHLPHVVAAELARLVLDPKNAREQFLLCANGFRDSTRIASGSPEMWRDISLANREHLSEALDSLIQNLEGFRSILERGDGAALLSIFEQAKSRRDQWCVQQTSASPE